MVVALSSVTGTAPQSGTVLGKPRYLYSRHRARLRPRPWRWGHGLRIALV